MDLRATRYLTSETAAIYGYIIAKKLRGFDFQETLRFYEQVLQGGDQDTIALLGANDRFFLLTVLMGRKDAAREWLFDRCREVEEKPDSHLDLWARDHYKSTIITVAGIIQEVLVDPEITVGIFSHTKAIAAKFLAQIMREFETNDWLKRLYADVLWEEPRKQAPIWSIAGGVIVKRAGNPKESTIEAHGLVTGQPTSKHFRLRVYDDVVTRESVTTPEMIRTTTEAFELSDNLGTQGGRFWVVGTRYHFGDTYGKMISDEVVTVRIYPATANGKLNGKPVLLTEQQWEAKKKFQRSTVAAQMLQNPLAGNEAMFDVTWFRPYSVRPTILNVYIMGDPSKGRSTNSDRTAIAVVGIDPLGNKFLLDGVRHRMKLSERWAYLRNFYRKWSKARGVQYCGVGYEVYGLQSDLEYFEERMDREEIHFAIRELNWVREGLQSKKDRVERLEPDFRDSRFYLPGLIWRAIDGPCYWRVDPEKSSVRYVPATTDSHEIMRAKNGGMDDLIARAIQRLDEDRKPYDVTKALMDEMEFFPFSPRDDLVDAVSRIYDMDPFPAEMQAPGVDDTAPETQTYADA